MRAESRDRGDPSGVGWVGSSVGRRGTEHAGGWLGEDRTKDPQLSSSFHL